MAKRGATITMLPQQPLLLMVDETMSCSRQRRGAVYESKN
jgi:hypothetical protein